MGRDSDNRQELKKGSHRMRHRSVAFLLLLTSFAGQCDDVFAQDRAARAEVLIRAAEVKQLWTNRCWLTLGHYKSTWVGLRSRIDDPAFFLAPDGKTNPKAEMMATLRAFFEPVVDERRHAVSRFPARLHWLQEQLDWDGAGLPMRDSPAFRAVYEKFKPTAVTLVYPAAYMNNLMTMFGHDMLVFESHPQNRLLARSVTYAAYVEPASIPVFIGKSILGFFKGYYGSMPYYDAVKEYTAMGHRDMWEYSLDFNQAEVDQMLRHACELQHIYSYYYFFSENCTYNLFYLLDAARPSLRATDFERSFVIPVEAVKFIDTKLGIVHSKTYRPSQVSRIRYLAAQLDADARKEVVAMARGQTTVASLQAVVTNQSERMALDFALEYTQFLFNDRELSAEAYRTSSMDLFRARSKLDAEEDLSLQIPIPDRPEDGHAPSRLSVGAGIQKDDAFMSIRYRPAFHGLNDNDQGFVQGTQLEALNLDLRYYQRGGLELQGIELLNLASLAPHDDLFKPLSWKTDIGFAQLDRHEDQDSLAFHCNVGVGGAWHLSTSGLWFLMPEVGMLAGKDLRADYALGAGPSFGVIQSLTSNWKLVVQADVKYFGVGDDFVAQRYSLRQDYRISQSVSMGLEVSHQRIEYQSADTAQVLVNYYW